MKTAAGARAGATLLLCSALTLTQAAAAAPVVEGPHPRWLRLDDSLALLAPYRDPAGHPHSSLSIYQRGAFGHWLRRSWQTLDWAPFGSTAINPRFDVTTPAADPCVERLAATERRWPYVHERVHWFVDGPGEAAMAMAPPLHVSGALMPPWLERLDPHYADFVVQTFGCGRGGACSPGARFPADGFVALWDALSPKDTPTPWWVCRERPVLFGRQGSEQDRFVVLHCDGSVPVDALERLSVMARPVDTERPARFPSLPDPKAPRGEWMPGVRLMHPRLLWVLHQVALSWPWRSVYIYSGYRPADDAVPGSHTSHHAEGRALDIQVQGVPNEELLSLCRRLPDLGCGYYPHNKFVHVDVRPRGSGKALWVDTSGPGEPSHYVDSWPGVVDGGALVWAQPVSRTQR
jgi:hypothetical protein